MVLETERGVVSADAIVKTRTIKTLDIMHNWGFCRQDPEFDHWDDEAAIAAAGRRTESTLMQMITGQGTPREKCWVLLSDQIFDDRTLRLIACDAAEHLLYHWEDAYPQDARVRQAIVKMRLDTRQGHSNEGFSARVMKHVLRQLQDKKRKHAGLPMLDDLVARTLEAMDPNPDLHGRVTQARRATLDRMKEQAEKMEADPDLIAKFIEARDQEPAEHTTVARMRKGRYGVTRSDTPKRVLTDEQRLSQREGQAALLKETRRKIVELERVQDLAVVGAEGARVAMAQDKRDVELNLRRAGPPRAEINQMSVLAAMVTASAVSMCPPMFAARGAAWIAAKDNDEATWLLGRIRQYVRAADGDQRL